MPAPTTPRPVTKMVNEKFMYLAEQWDHGVVLSATPIQQGGLHPGHIRVSECTTVATVFSVYDALMVARLHAQANGATQPVMS